MTEFEKNEEKGRWLLEQVLKAGKVDNYWFSNEMHSVWDAKYSTERVENIVEIKVRSHPVTKYPDWILEVKKYNSLKAIIDQRRSEIDKLVKAYYVNFFDDNYFCFWDIEQIDLSTVTKKGCKSTTAINGSYILKQILPLKVEDAVLFGQLVNENQVKVISDERTND